MKNCRPRPGSANHQGLTCMILHCIWMDGTEFQWSTKEVTA
jgi:hypothetical protein